MRITSEGKVLLSKTVDSFATAGGRFDSNGSAFFTVSNERPLYLNRLTNDGELAVFYQDTVLEGSISVSGTTVSYNGAHLARWSQLPDGAVREEILRGTVLSNIDEMCNWGEEDNEQLNRMKISDVEGDPNVAGVFQDWDDDDDAYTDDFYCAMTGDFIIRIAEGVMVQRGDLLMSAGNGTAKPQDDDIVRSKTVAKVTSTHVTCTYDDGSYCVPCVLMAC
jgi:cyclophilin family peptidyl-prolyl cis-trans isomerase